MESRKGIDPTGTPCLKITTMAKLEYLIIHCTDTPPGREVTSKEIRDWHTLPVPQGRGWKQVGYADMIHLDGKVENLVPYNEDDSVDAWEITNGATGFNGNGRHIVYVGGRNFNGQWLDSRTPAQKVALEKYVKAFIKAHPNCKVAGHYQVNPGRDCPSFHTPDWLKSVGILDKNIVL